MTRGETLHPSGDAGRPVLILHAGAGSVAPDQIGPERLAAYRTALEEALRTGWAVLSSGGSAVDAVEATIRVMEDSPRFNAGRGAVFNADGRNEMDAAIMDGWTHRAGAVAAVQRIRNPISAARAVMERTRHVLLVGAEADRWAAGEGLQTEPPRYFFTDRRWKSLQNHVAAQAKMHGTVGAIALDQQGHLAAGTSTGGLTGKLPGRVGDSPIVGAGTWADRGCAISGTGEGEFFIRYTVARDICARVEERGQSLQRAADAVILHELVDLHAEGGVIAMDAQGNVSFSFNTSYMARGVMRESRQPVVQFFH
jgi:beta-aspartyl-peptidase (threonine type)